jgi:hypothetical protein
MRGETTSLEAHIIVDVSGLEQAFAFDQELVEGVQG